jgi:LacI family transcriptional regulator
METKPMERSTREPLPLRLSPRCLARTRSGTPCQKPAAKGKKRCRLHGGEDAFDRGEAVVTVVSNVADVPGIAYFGIDNYRAGRTAGFIMGHFARRRGRVMFLSGRNDYAAHQQRTAGCRDALNTSFPNLRCDSSSFETLDDDYRCFVAVAEAMRSTHLAGIYNSGAGSAGITKALEQFDQEHSVTWITHELSDDHRQYLLSGALAMVIDQDPDMQATMALRYLVERLDSNGAKSSRVSRCEFHLYFPENVKEGQYLLADDLSPNHRPAARAPSRVSRRPQPALPGPSVRSSA